MMKKVISGKQLQEKIKESINLLCDTVKQTLGPQGNNVLIDHSLFSPFITNDGATIARNIESEDEIVNTILEIAKEASLKTNETVGDGTTTTLALLQSIMNASLDYIEKETNPILLKKELNTYLKEILKAINDLKLEIDPNKLKAIATIAANDDEIGRLLSKVFQTVGSKNAIFIEEGEKQTLEVSYLKGYHIQTELASDYFLNEPKKTYQNANILIFQNTLFNIEDIAFILNDCMKNKKSLVIFAEDFEELLVKEIISMNQNEELDCCLVKIQTYGMQKRKIEKDLEIITGAKRIEKQISLENIGIAKQIEIEKDRIRINFETTEKIKNYISLLNKEAREIKDDFDKDFVSQRIAMFSEGLATIKIGAPTKTESHEIKMRMEDALCALESAKDGVLLGGGITLLKIAEKIKAKTTAETIFKKALEVPFQQILANAGLDNKAIKQEIINNQFQKIYNVKTEKWEDVKNSSVLDSYNVTIESLKNAVSIATMLLTTTSLVINEYVNNSNKENEYNEL